MASQGCLLRWLGRLEEEWNTHVIERLVLVRSDHYRDGHIVLQTRGEAGAAWVG